MQLFGFLNINKPKGITSFDVIYKLRKILGIKKIGHAGTLDPLATGVLPIALGGATKLIEYLQSDKKYIGTIKFGEISNTYDEEGEKTFVSKPDFGQEKLETALLEFKGKIKQAPPMYSAIKVGGKKLYELARAGKTIEVQAREIEIYDIKILKFTGTIAEIEIHCSSGTYIRSLAHDLGQNLGCGAYLADLKRIQAGNFEIKNSIEIENQNLLTNLINPALALPFQQYELNETELLKIKNGNPIAIRAVNKGNSTAIPQAAIENEKILLMHNGALISIASRKGPILKVDKVLNIC